MTLEAKTSLSIFMTGLNIAVEQASETGFTAPLNFTLLADYMQIQCLLEDNVDLLEFEIPSKLHKTISDIAKTTEAEMVVFNTDKPNIYIAEFNNKDEQDKIIKVFEMMSFQGKRAYPCPDIYLGNKNVDKQLCNAILEIIRRLFSD